MKYDITDLLIFFDEQAPATDEERGYYWFGKNRSDGLVITLSFSIYERYVGVLVNTKSDTSIAEVNMKNCSEIRILDKEKKCLEIIHEDQKGRCFLHLTGDSIVTYEE